MRKLFPAIGFLLFALLTNTFAQTEKPVAAATAEPPITLPTSNKSGSSSGISYGLVIDNSGSYRQILENVIEAAKNLVESNGVQDETFLVRFVSSEKIKLLQDFTASKDEIHSAADEMFVEGGLTAILDAVEFSARHMAEKANAGDSGTPARPKILVLITDGDERQSSAKIESVLKFLKDNQIRVFALGLSEEKVSTKLLDRLTKETGGKKFVPKTRAEIPAAVRELAAAIRAR